MSSNEFVRVINCPGYAGTATPDVSISIPYSEDLTFLNIDIVIFLLTRYSTLCHIGNIAKESFSLMVFNMGNVSNLSLYL